MDAQGKDVARINEVTASMEADIATGRASAAFKVRTTEPVLAVVAVIGVIGVIGVGAVMLTRGLPLQQGAELALPLAAAA